MQTSTQLKYNDNFFSDEQARQKLSSILDPMYKVIDQFQLKDKKVFIRTDYNVPIKNGVITDDSRIRESIPTIEYAIKSGARIILASHLGRPKGSRREEDSLLPVAKRLSELLGRDVIFPESSTGDATKKLANELRAGDVMLLENLRFNPEEEKNDQKFAQALASLAEIYIDDAFGCVHRAHASTAGMVHFFKEKGIGFLMQKEISFFTSLFKDTKKPFLAILGGAKVSDKIGVIENLMNHVDALLIGGAMAYTFLKAQGYNVGKSLVEEAKLHQAERLLTRAKNKGIEIILPVDSLLCEKLENGLPVKIGKVGDNWTGQMGLDIGPATIELFGDKIKEAKTLFWNGPMGAFEFPAFQKGTFELARIVSESTALSVVGGGDSLSAIKKSGYESKISHLSTGGGAALEFLEGKPLPGLKVLEV